eukprot:1439339-Pyramimonas_sp.AAC.1
MGASDDKVLVKSDMGIASIRYTGHPDLDRIGDDTPEIADGADVPAPVKQPSCQLSCTETPGVHRTPSALLQLLHN